jgi:hypothetical protein
MSASSVMGRTRAMRQASTGLDAVLDQGGGVDQQAGGDAFVQAVALQVAGGLADLHQLAGGGFVQAGFLGQDGGFQVRRPDSRSRRR